MVIYSKPDRSGIKPVKIRFKKLYPPSMLTPEPIRILSQGLFTAKVSQHGAGHTILGQALLTERFSDTLTGKLNRCTGKWRVSAETDKSLYANPNLTTTTERIR